MDSEYSFLHRKTEKTEKIERNITAPVQQAVDMIGINSSDVKRAQKGKSGPVFDESEMKSITADADSTFHDFWTGQSDGYVDSLHANARARDVKAKLGFKDDQDRAGLQEMNRKMSEASQKNLARTGKSRKNHMSESSQAYVQAADKQQKMVRARSEGDLLSAVNHAEEMISLMTVAGQEEAKATGKRDASEARKKLALAVKEAKMRLNLYEEALKDKSLTAEQRTEIEKRLHRAAVSYSKYLAQLSVAEDSDKGQLAQEIYGDYDDMTEDSAFDMAMGNRFNTDETLRSRIWGRYKWRYFNDSGRRFGYIRTWTCKAVNGFLRAKEKFRRGVTDPNTTQDEYDKLQEEFEQARQAIRPDAEAYVRRKIMKHASREELSRYSAELLEKVQGTISDLDDATTLNVIQKKCKVYRMIDKAFLSWGLGIPDFDKLSPDEAVREINLRHGKTLEDSGFMSTAYCMSRYFRTQPIMLTLLTPAGKKCFATANFEEAEVIFGRNTRYTVIGAVNRAKQPKKMKVSAKIPDGAKTADEIRTNETMDFTGIEIICKVQLNEDEQKSVSAG